MRTQLLLSAALPLAGMALLSACQSEKKNTKKPFNIVYIMTDDHTAQMMSCYDTRYAHTPNLDRIAQDGVLFSNSYVANSLSGPSRACMVTGKHSHKNGFYDNTNCVFDNTQQTFPKLLQKAGYQTALVANGIWNHCLQALTIGKSFLDKVATITQASSRRKMTPYGSMVI